MGAFSRRAEWRTSGAKRSELMLVEGIKELKREFDSKPIEKSGKFKVSSMPPKSHSFTESTSKGSR